MEMMSEVANYFYKTLHHTGVNAGEIRYRSPSLGSVTLGTSKLRKTFNFNIRSNFLKTYGFHIFEPFVIFIVFVFLFEVLCFGFVSPSIKIQQFCLFYKLTAIKMIL